MLSQTSKEISIERILDEVEVLVTKLGYNLKKDWRELTEKKIADEWSQKILT